MGPTHPLPRHTRAEKHTATSRGWAPLGAHELGPSLRSVNSAFAHLPLGDIPRHPQAATHCTPSDTQTLVPDRADVTPPSLGESAVSRPRLRPTGRAGPSTGRALKGPTSPGFALLTQPDRSERTSAGVRVSHQHRIRIRFLHLRRVVTIQLCAHFLVPGLPRLLLPRLPVSTSLLSFPALGN